MNHKALTTLINEVVTPLLEGGMNPEEIKNPIIPLIFLKQVNDIFKDDLDLLAEQLGGLDAAEMAADLEPTRLRVFVPSVARWEGLLRYPEGLGRHLNKALRVMSKISPLLEDLPNMFDYTTTVYERRVVSDEQLAAVMGVLNRYRLTTSVVGLDFLGQVYEYLLHTYTKKQGQSRGEFYTPPVVAELLARILDPNPGEEIYDPTCGSGVLMLGVNKYFFEKFRGNPPGAIKFYCQEFNQEAFNVARMNAFVFGINAEIAFGNTLTNPAFRAGKDSIRQFDVVIANPPWNQKAPEEIYKADRFNRFPFGPPPRRSSDWGWVQHMYASMKDSGRMAVVLDSGAVSRGSGISGWNKERDIRKAFVEADLVEAVILLPRNLFLSTTAPGVILVIRKKKRHPGEVLMIDTSIFFANRWTNKYLSNEHLEQIIRCYKDWKTVDGFSVVVSNDELLRNDYNLSPSRYVVTDSTGKTPPFEEAERVFLGLKEERLEDHIDRVFTYGAAYINGPDGIRLKSTEIGLIPDGWGVVKLGDLIKDVFVGATPSTKVPEFWGGHIPWVSNAYLSKDDVIINHAQRTLTPAGLRAGGKIAPRGSLIVSTRAEVGKAAVAGRDIAINQSLTALILKDTVDALFLAFYFKSKRAQNYIKRVTRGTFIKSLYRKDLLDMPVPLPPLEEQTCITKFLTSLNHNFLSEEA